jgi:hypothetical protein
MSRITLTLPEVGLDGVYGVAQQAGGAAVVQRGASVRKRGQAAVALGGKSREVNLVCVVRVDGGGSRTGMGQRHVLKAAAASSHNG